jgi:WD40 repeat protein
MIAVGDSPQVFLYNITSSGEFVKSATLTGFYRLTKGSNDAGFSCSWNYSSDKFAVASQDGFVNVWDVRNSEKLKQLRSNQNPQVKGACRSVKFSPTCGMDLLLYSEHISYVNLVDTRSFTEKQVIRVAPQGIDQHISGIAFSPDSKSIFVGILILYKGWSKVL